MLLLAFGGCDTPTTKQGYARAASGDTSISLAVPSGVSGDQIDTIVASTLVARNWSIRRQEPGVVVARLHHRGIAGELEITHDPDRITITSRSEDSEGTPFVPLRWMEILRKDLEKRLALASIN